MADGSFYRTRRDVGNAVNAMFGRARLKDFAPGEGVRAGAFRERFDEEAWIPITLPGDVQRALLDAGRIEDPFYDRNEDGCAWIEDREWWYRMSFDGPQELLGPDERLRFVFHGLDTFATIYLNGEELGSHSNMFREAVFDVGERIRPAENTLAILFDRPRDHVGEDLRDQWGRNPERRRFQLHDIPDGEGSSVRLEAPAYAYFVHLDIPAEATRFSDNYLDFEPGRERTISVTNEKRELEPENIKVSWR